MDGNGNRQFRIDYNLYSKFDVLFCNIVSLRIMNTFHCLLPIDLNYFLDVFKLKKYLFQPFYCKLNVFQKVFCGSLHILVVSNLHSKSTILFCQLLYPLRKVRDRPLFGCLQSLAGGFHCYRSTIMATYFQINRCRCRRFGQILRLRKSSGRGPGETDHSCNNR